MHKKTKDTQKKSHYKTSLHLRNTWFTWGCFTCYQISIAMDWELGIDICRNGLRAVLPVKKIWLPLTGSCGSLYKQRLCWLELQRLVSLVSSAFGVIQDMVDGNFLSVQQMKRQSDSSETAERLSGLILPCWNPQMVHWSEHLLSEPKWFLNLCYCHWSPPLWLPRGHSPCPLRPPLRCLAGLEVPLRPSASLQY